MTETIVNYQNELNAAVEWWTSQLKGPTKLDNGDNDPIARGLAGIVEDQERSKITPEHIEAFKKHLYDVLEADIQRASSYRGEDFYLCVGVDYHPDMFLREAAERAGFDSGMCTFPWKTNMWIEPNDVKVSCGYGAGTETLYPLPAVPQPEEKPTV